jgi:hypothetical protein
MSARWLNTFDANELMMSQVYDLNDGYITFNQTKFEVL